MALLKKEFEKMRMEQLTEEEITDIIGEVVEERRLKHKPISHVFSWDEVVEIVRIVEQVTEERVRIRGL